MNLRSNQSDHFIAALFISAAGVIPSNKERGYILRRLIRRGLDHYVYLGGKNISVILETIATQYSKTDLDLEEKFEILKNTILEEAEKYEKTKHEARKFIEKKYKSATSDQQQATSLKKEGDELFGITEISAEDAFTLYTTHGLSPTQIKSLGYTFNDQQFARKMEEHQKISKKGAEKKFAGGLADHTEKTVMGHTATHLMHQALRDVLGKSVHQSGSNITPERVRFDYNFDRKLTPEEVQKVEDIVNEKIKKNLQVHFEIMPLAKAKEIGAIGLFDEKYGNNVKVYFIGSPSTSSGQPRSSFYSVEFCGGPHVEFTGKLKRFKIIKEEGLGKGMRRIYAQVT